MTHGSQVLHAAHLHRPDGVELDDDLAGRGNGRNRSAADLVVVDTPTESQSTINAANQPQRRHHLRDVRLLTQRKIWT